MSALLLEAGSEVVGVMFMNYRQPREFNDWDRALHKAFATHAAFAIRYARTVNRVAEDTHAVLGKVLNPIFQELGSRLELLKASILSSVEDPHLRQHTLSVFNSIERDTDWITEAYAPKATQKLSSQKLLAIFCDSRPNGPARVTCDPSADDAIGLTVKVVESHLVQVAESLMRTAEEAHARSIQVGIHAQDVGQLELRFQFDEPLPMPRERAFAFDSERDLPLPSRDSRSEHPPSGGRTLWWCRTVLLTNGAWLSLAQTNDTVFRLRFPLVPKSEDTEERMEPVLSYVQQLGGADAVGAP
jgi:hypothetical protein